MHGCLLCCADVRVAAPGSPISALLVMWGPLRRAGPKQIEELIQIAAPYDLLGVQTFHGLLYGRWARLL